MRRIVAAIRIFLLTLASRATAEQVEKILRGERISPVAPAREEANAGEAARPVDRTTTVQRPARSDALTLLAALQREARLVDLIQEPLEAYSDAQIGAAARDVLRDSRAVLERMFAIQPVVPQAEGASLELSPELDSGEYRFTGEVLGQPPYRGRLVHPGWRAKKCDLPAWTGTGSAATVIAPAELEVSRAAGSGD
jgi:hypothetical protein